MKLFEKLFGVGITLTLTRVTASTSSFSSLSLNIGKSVFPPVTMTLPYRSFRMSVSHLPTHSTIDSWRDESSEGEATPNVEHLSASSSDGLNIISHVLNRSGPTSIVLPSGSS